jgi:hypothetical protein
MGLYTAFAYLTVVAVGTVALPVVGPSALAALGFSSTGVVGGSYFSSNRRGFFYSFLCFVVGTVAAAAQSWLGNVAAGTVFAKFTSIAMTPTP